MSAPKGEDGRAERRDQTTGEYLGAPDRTWRSTLRTAVGPYGRDENLKDLRTLGAVNPLLASVAATVSRKLARHQDRPPRDARRLPLWRLLIDEVVYLFKQAVRPPAVWAWTLAAMVALVVMVGLAEATPGPVVSIGWRTVAAVALAAMVAVVVRRWPHRRNG